MIQDYKTELMLQVKQIALENPDGFTLQLATMELVTKGIAVGHDATQNCYGNAGIYHCIQHALLNGGYIGGWIDPNTGWMQYDSLRLFSNLNKAVKWGRKQGQHSIYYIERGLEIKL